MPTDRHNLRATSAVGPSWRIRTVTPTDDAPLADGLTRALFVGVGGSVAVEDATGTVVVIESVASQYHPVSVRRVLASGTTAASILALY